MTHIISMERLEETVFRSGGSGDNWHMTWAEDDLQYVGLCDGQGWPEMAGYVKKERGYNSRIYAIRGDPPDIRFIHLPGFPDLLSEEAPNVNRYYGFGIIALGSCIYQFLSTPNHPFTSGPDPRFVGAKLIYSQDLGKSWLNQDGSPVHWEPWAARSRANMVFLNEPGETFSLLTVVQMGRNYQHNRDGYVYVCAPNGNVEGSMNQLVMFRAPRERLLERASYEFFVSRRRDGSARWSSDISARGSVHTFPAGWVNTKLHPYAWHPSVTYNAPLGLYLMANWGMGCDANGMWFGKPSYLGFWIAPNPWGPWEQVHEETAWMPEGDANARAYQPQICPRWIAEDGKSFWLAYTDFQPQQPRYCFNCQKVLIRTR